MAERQQALTREHFLDAAIQNREHLIELLELENERRPECQPVRVEPGNQSYSLNVTYRLVARIDWDSGATAMWVDPVSEGDAPAVVRNETQSVTQSLALLYYGTDGTIDDIRIGTTFADVIPEPSTSLLVLLGMTGSAIQRRRRRGN